VTSRRWYARSTDGLLQRIFTGGREEPPDHRPEALHVDQKGIVPLDRRQLLEADAAAALPQAGGKFALLVNRKQEIGGHTDHERALGTDPAQPCLHGAAMIGEIEKIAGAREVEIAVRIELPGKFPRVGFEIALDLEVRCKRIATLALCGDPLPAESLLPLRGRAIGDHAELAGELHAGRRAAAGRIVAAIPARIAPDHLPLQ